MRPQPLVEQVLPASDEASECPMGMGMGMRGWVKVGWEFGKYYHPIAQTCLISFGQSTTLA